jgi:hypothetical protein
VSLLHAGFAVTLVVEHDDGEIARALRADGGEAPQAHQHLPVPGDDEHAAFRLREGQSQSDHASGTHRPPQWKGEGVIAGRGAIPSGGSESGDDENIATVLKQRLYNLTATKDGAHRFS